MLGKLIKYEFRATAIYFLPIYAVLVLISGMNYAIGLISNRFHSAYSTFATFSLSSVYMLLAFGLAITTFLVIIIRFYKNLLGTEGYLMFTLPVSVEENILAKLIPSIVWFLGSGILGMLTITPAMGLRMSDNPFISMFSSFSIKNIPELLLVFLFIVGCLATSFLFYYLCMCIGQMFNSHRFLASAGAYIGIQAVLQVGSVLSVWALASRLSDISVAAWLSRTFAFLDTLPEDAFIYIVMGVACLVVFVIAAALFFIDSAILRKKLNLI